MLKLYISDVDRTVGKLELPMPVEDFKRRLGLLQAEGRPKSLLTIYQADCPVINLSWPLRQVRLDDDSALQKLIRLAEVIDGMDTAGHYHLSKAVSADYNQSLDDILRAATRIKPDSLDRYEIIPEAASRRDLGKWLVEHDRLTVKVPEALRSYMDYQSIGTDYLNSHEGEFLSFGYVGIRTEAMEQMREKQKEYGSIRPAGESSQESSSQGFQMGGPV